MNTKPEIPQGTTSEEIQQRKKIIKDFYAQWNASNPQKQIYNIDLKDFINVRFLSIQETAQKAANRYNSTVAVTFLTEILEKATEIKRNKPKQNENQKRFCETIVMEYNKINFGRIKLTVGVLKGSKQKIQYCITTIENG